MKLKCEKSGSVKRLPIPSVHSAGVGGFTLIELIITVALVALIATVAVPAFSTLIENNRVTTEANRIASSLQLARSEAVKGGEEVTLSATGGDFNEGWCVHTGASCDSAAQIRLFDAPRVTAFSNDGDSVTFSNRGERAAPNSDYSLRVEPESCDEGEPDRQRVIRVGASGRTGVTRSGCS